nr:polycystin-1-like isoform X6 [Pan paniscus]
MEMLLRARSVPGFCWGSSCGILTLTIRGIGTVEICISQMRKQVMVFPGLRLSREAFLTTAEFGTQELRRPAQLRLQVYRLLSTAGTPENGSEPESRSPDNRTQLAPACMPGGRWCPGANICLPLDASCHPQACANGCTSGPGLPGAPYALWREFLFSVPAGPPAQCSVCGPDLGLFPASPQATFLSAARGLGLLTRHTQPAGPSHVLATSDLRPPTSDLCGALAPLPVGEALAWALGTSCASSSSLPAQPLLPVCQVLACVLSPCVPLSATVLPVLVPSTVGRLPEVWLTKRGALRVHPHPSCRGPRAMTVRT